MGWPGRQLQWPALKSAFLPALSVKILPNDTKLYNRWA